MTVTPDERNPIEVLADEFLERHRRGEAPSIQEYVDLHPDHEDEIRGIFPTALAMEGLREHKVETHPTYTGFDPNQLERLGDYRIGKMIGRGGMGIVLEAEQESLDRPVAIKILPASSLLDERRLERFNREARTAARLIHPNIVPVYGVGEENGLKYYVMQLIDGVSLDRVLASLKGEPVLETESDCRSFDATAAANLMRSEGLEERRETSSHMAPTADTSTKEVAATMTVALQDRTYWQNVSQIGLQVANALQYAHGRGTLHRDIKPANLLLDGQGNAWVTDFGIAKALEQDGMTRSGDIVGTLQYMAPEQSEGRDDARSDVYSLGLTLYELLTLKRAWDDELPGRLLQRMQSEEATPPRKINPRIPRDLDTIVMKAIAREPDHRYGTAGEMEEDLSRWQKGLPISARRILPVEQLWRWCRRNRAVASLAATAVAALVMAVVLGWQGFLSTREALGREEKRAEEARLASIRAERNLALSMEAFENVFDHVVGRDPILAVDDDNDGADGLLQQPLLSQEDALLLEGMLIFYDRFTALNQNNEALALETARAHRRVGDIHSRLAHLEPAQTAYDAALRLFNDIEDKGDGLVKSEMAMVYNDLGILASRGGQQRDAVAQHNKAMELLVPFKDQPGAIRCRFELIRTHNLLGNNSARTRSSRAPGEGRRAQEAADHHRAALALAGDLLRISPRKPEYLLARAKSQLFLARSLRYGRRHAESTRHLKNAIDTLESLAEDHETNPSYRYELALAYASPSLEALPFERDEIESKMRVACGIMENLVDEFPKIPEYKASLSMLINRLGDVLAQREKYAEAEFYYRTTLQIFGDLYAVDPSLWSVWREGTRHIIRLADFLVERKRPQEARDILLGTIDGFESLLKTDTRNRSVRFSLGRQYHALSRAWDALEDPASAQKARDRATELQRSREVSPRR